MIAVNVKLFAVARDLAGREELTLSLPRESSVSDLVEALVHRYPRLEEWKRYLRCALNHQYISSDQILREGDEVAIIPPVSGG
ncbi:MAG: molybdopterin converting factor subunit 1 [Ignavibacteria bacterium]|nr:molybdopterin converting factor subunit 1 [Ignavibacteria bacterium]